MKYIVIRDFSDSTDNGYIYRVGDVFPHSGKEVPINRINGLLGTDNLQHIPLIREDTEKPRKDTLDVDPDETTSKETEAKKRPKKGRKKHARTDS